MINRRTNRHITATLALVAALAAGPVMAQDDAAEEAAPEPLWTNALGLSYVGTSGNTDTSSLGLDFKSERRPTPWGMAFVATFTRAEDDGEVTAEQYLVGARGSRALNDRWSLFAGLSWAKDTFGGFDSRSIAEAGAEYLLFKNDKHTLSADAGLTWTDEDRIEPNPDVSYMGAVLGLAYEWKISDNASFTQLLAFYPNFEESSDWRLNSDTGLQAAVNSWLAVKLGFGVRYRNKPIDDNEDTDTTSSASVVFTF